MIKWLVLAWRNIWRNKRRTLISAASVAFAVLFSISMSSLQKGGWDRMLNNVVSFYFGYAQIHAKGYWDEQTIDRSIELIPDQLAQWEKAIGGYKLRPRLESFALASTGPATMGIMISGVDPEGGKPTHQAGFQGGKGEVFYRKGGCCPAIGGDRYGIGIDGRRHPCFAESGLSGCDGRLQISDLWHTSFWFSRSQ
jgi:ABC-type lipoprotein release transport system permease subunit